MNRFWTFLYAITLFLIAGLPLPISAQMVPGISNALQFSPINTGLPVVRTPTTWDPSNKAAGVVLSNGNLDAQTPNSGASGAVTIYSASTNKWYVEVTLINQNAAGSAIIGIAPTTGYNPPGGDIPGFTTTSIGYRSNGSVYQNSTVMGTYATYTIGDVISILIDLDNDIVTFWKNGVSQGSRSLGALSYTVGIGDVSSSANYLYRINAGQSAFSYQRPLDYFGGFGTP